MSKKQDAWIHMYCAAVISGVGRKDAIIAADWALEDFDSRFPDVETIEQPNAAVLKTYIEDLDLGVRLYNSVKAFKKNTLEDILQMDIRRFSQQRNVGPKTIKQLESVLLKMGLKIGMDLSQIK